MAYGRALDDLGSHIGAEIVTKEHRDLIRRADRFGIAYKVSGAGGGDLGLAFGLDPEALRAFEAAVSDDYELIELDVDAQGLTVETKAQ